MATKTARPSLGDIRTISSRRLQANLMPHELYMKLTALEIERSRRNTERTAAMNRVNQIDQRIHEIETEQDAIKLLIQSKTGSSFPTSNGKLSKTDGFNLNY